MMRSPETRQNMPEQGVTESTVEEKIFQGIGVKTDSKQALQKGIAELFPDSFFDEDPAVAGMALEEKLQRSLNSDQLKENQINATTERILQRNEWIDGLAQFAARTATEVSKRYVYAEDQERIEGFMGQVTSRLIGMTRPETQVGVTVFAGIANNGDVVGTYAQRSQFFMRYEAALNRLAPKALPMQEGEVITFPTQKQAKIPVAVAAD
jgi:hypothetical protein